MVQNGWDFRALTFITYLSIHETIKSNSECNLLIFKYFNIHKKHIYPIPDWFQIGKGVRQGCILSPCLFNLYAEYIMRNAELEEAQAGIKTARRNISNLRYADDTTVMAESEEELKSLLMKAKEESEEAVLKLNLPKT